MTKEEWLQEFNKRLPKFEWFITDYFLGLRSEMLEVRKEGKAERLLTIMNDIWFYLPDNEFNIIENPPGWSDFLFLLENPFEK
jgi:hypothetical protein